MQRIGLPFILLALASSSFAGENNQSVSVAAGEFSRQDVLVTMSLPRNLSGPVALKHDGMLIPVQVEKNGQGCFILKQLNKGTTARYELVQQRADSATSASQVSATRQSSKAKFSYMAKEDGASAQARALIEYQAEPSALPRANIKPLFQRGAYLHPIYTLSGKMVTDDYPPNHLHHHGVWWSWTNTEFDGRHPDFWNMGEGKGRVDFVSLEETWSGPVHGGFRAQHRFMDLTASPPVNALNETWEVRVYAPTVAKKYWMFDLVSEQRCATAIPLKLPEYRYGGVGLRGNWAWNGKTNVSFLTSEGERDRDKGNATRGRWCDMSGLLDGAIAGIAILGHPDNFRAPQPMRLHPTEPFFNFAPQQAGDMEIKAGEVYVCRYRFVIHDGALDKAELDRLWNDYAHPPAVTVANVEK